MPRLLLRRSSISTFVIAVIVTVAGISGELLRRPGAVCPGDV